MPSRIRKFLRNRNKAGYRRRRRAGWMQKPIGWYARKAFQGVKFIKGLINVEKKFIDTSISGAPGTTPNIIGLCSLGQGSADNQRNGDSILAKYLSVNETIQINAAASSDFVRIVYVLDKENRGTAPGYTDIFDGSAVTSKLNRNNMDRFVILSDKCYALNVQGRSTVAHKIFKKLDFHIKYGSNNGDTTDYRQNAIFRIALGADNANKATVIEEARIAFYDN